MPDSRPILVLNVNDDDVTRYTLTRTLKRGGFDVIEASSGEEGIARVRDTEPDVVVLDVKLPDVSGFEVCRRIKSDPTIASTSVLLTSAAFVSTAQRVEGLEGGADAYLVQPAEAIELVATVKALVRARRAEDERSRLLLLEQRARAQAEESERRYRYLADATPQIVWTADPSGMVDYFNQRWYDFSGLTEAQSLGAGWGEVVHPDDRARTVAQWSEAVAKITEYEIEYRLRRASDGTHRWHLGRALPLRDASGNVVRWFGTCTDIDHQKRAEANAHFLAEVSTALAFSLDSKQTVDKVVRLPIPHLADFCILYGKDARGLAEALAVAHRDRAKEPQVLEVHGKGRAHDGQGAGHELEVFRSGTAQVFTRVDEATLAQLAGGGREEIAVLRELGVASLMVVPLAAHGEVFGAMAFASTSRARPYGEADLELASDFALRSAIALDNARLYEAAERERVRVEEANRAKDIFLATVSHELRTPLNAMVGWTRLLRAGRVPEAKTPHALETIERNADVQLQLIEDLLDVSRIVNGKLRLDVRQVELIAVVEAALDAVRPAADAKGVRLMAVLDPQAGPVSGDPDRLQQVVWNLLTNAVKFTPRGGRVQVRLESVESHVEIEVTDSGKGIPPDFLPYVFDRFRQAEGGTTRVHAGLGLGLAIVRHLVELHGGTVDVRSEGEGSGATFVVVLPLSAVREDRERVSPHPRARTRLDFANAPNLRGLRVLVVDDEESSRDLVASLLEQCDAEVISVASARDAITALRRAPPDILLSDIGMPGEDGYDLIRAVRALPPDAGGRVPAAALTAYARTEDRTKALRAGFNMHVPKPIEPSELLVIVASLAGRVEAPAS